MIEKATETFWKNLNGLGFVDLALVKKWRELAETPGATWLQLCQAIQQDSRLTSGHLQLLTSEQPATPLLVGGLLILRSIPHPLNWEAYEAVHVKLEKDWRVILLPEMDRDPSGPNFLARARKIAELDDPNVTKIVDLETHGSRYAMVLPTVRGERLGQIWAVPPDEMDWEQVAIQLISTLRRIHNAGIEVGTLDPMFLYFDQQRQELQLDDLVSSVGIDDDLIPSGLTTREESMVVAYRTRRAKFFQTKFPGKTPTSGSARDWMECAAWLDFAAHSLPSTIASIERDALTERWQKAAAELCSIYQGTDTEISQWYSHWFADEQLLDRPNNMASVLAASRNTDGVDLPMLINVEVKAQKLTTPPEPSATPTSSDTKTLPLPSGDKPKPGSVAHKQAAKREVEKRRKMVMAAAVIAPLPICLLVLLVMYLLQPTSDTLPNLANQSSDQAELPTVNLPDANLPDANLPDANLPDAGTSTKSQTSENPAGDVNQKLAPSPSPSPRNTPAKNSPPATDRDEDDELLADLKPLPNSDLLKESIDNPNPSSDKTTELPDTATIRPETTSTPPSTTSPVTAESQTTSRPAEDGYIAYTHVPTELDVVGAWREFLRTNTDNTSAETIQLGQLNSITAKRTQVEVNSTDPATVNNFRLVAKPSDDSAVVQQWEFQRVNNSDPKPLGYLQTTTDGQLQIVLTSAVESDWNNAENLGIELYYGEREVSHRIALSKGRRPTIKSDADQMAADVPKPARDVDSSLAPSSSSDSSPANNENLQANTTAESTIPDLPFDPRTATSKTWFKDTPGFPREGTEWRYQLADQTLQKIEKDHPLWKALRVRGKEEAYFTGDLLDSGSVVLMVTAESGNRTRLEGRLQLLTPSGLRPLKKDSAVDAAIEAEQFKQALKLQYDQLKSTRAKPGEGDLKQAELNRLDAMMKEMDRYKKALELVVQNNDAFLEKGLAFGLLHVVDGQDQFLLKSQSYSVANPTEK